MNRPTRLAFAAVLQLPIVAGVLLLTGTWSFAAEGGALCQEPTKPADVRNVGAIERVRVEKPDDTLVFAFGGERGARSRDVSLPLVDSVDLINGSIKPLDGESLAIR